MSATLSSQLSDLSTKLIQYYLTPIYVIGMLGNIFNVIIFLRRNLRTNSCSKYFVGMSIAQIIFFNSMAFLIRMISNATGYDVDQTISILCKFRMYLYVFSLGLMRQFLCLISIDRWIVTTKNARIRRFSSPHNVRWLIIGNTLCWILYSVHAPIGYRALPTRDCMIISLSVYELFYAIQMTVSSIVPFIVMVVFSVLTLRNVRNRLRRIDVVPQNNATVAATLPQSINHRRHETQLIKISILQVIFYVFLSMIATCYPLYSILTSSQRKDSNQTAIDSFLNIIGLLLMYTYSAITFVLYTLVSITFRKEFFLTCSEVFKYIQRPFHN